MSVNTYRKLLFAAEPYSKFVYFVGDKKTAPYLRGLVPLRRNTFWVVLNALCAHMDNVTSYAPSMPYTKKQLEENLFREDFCEIKSSKHNPWDYPTAIWYERNGAYGEALIYQRRMSGTGYQRRILKNEP